MNYQISCVAVELWSTSYLATALFNIQSQARVSRVLYTELNTLKYFFLHRNDVLDSRCHNQRFLHYFEMVIAIHEI